MISGKYPPAVCGIGDQACRLVKELRGLGHQVFVLTSAENATIPPVLLESIRRHQIELVHLQYHASSFRGQPAAALIPWLLKKRLAPNRAEVVTTLHELAGPSGPFLPGPFRRIWLLPLLLFSDAVIVSNQRDLSRLQILPFLKGKLHRVPFAPPFDPATGSLADRSQVRQSLGIREGETLLARFGFVHNTRLSLFPQILDALRRLLRQGHRIKLLLLGETSPSDRQETFDLARRFGVEERLLFGGHCPPAQVSRLLYAADVGIQLYPDGICEKRSSLLTAMAHGLPVLSTRKGPVPAPFRDGENILLVPVGDSLQTAESIQRLIEDSALRDRLGQGAAQTAAGFSWDRIGRETAALYESLKESAPR